MSFSATANPQCSIDLYPFEGGAYTINSKNSYVLSINVRKNIRADAGEFTIVLAPSGPNGTNQSPTWTEVITPMSLAIIAMARGDEQAIVMIGIVKSITERQAWQGGGIVTRNIVIEGRDFGYFYNMFSYNSLWFLGANGAQLLGTVPQPSQGLPAILSAGLVQGTPASVGAAWFNTIMAGASGLLSRTFVPYRGAQVFFPQAMASIFQQYPVQILPYGDSFIGYEGAWLTKFRQIFQFPWYEFFINTAPPNFYVNAGTTGSISGTVSGSVGAISFASGYSFYSSLLGPNVTASPAMVARINPIPRLTNSSFGPNGQGTLDGIDISAWNALPLFQPDSGNSSIFPFIDSTSTFSEDEVVNLYLINPTWFRGMLGGDGTGGNSNTFPWLALYAAAGDVASIHRYGYRFGNGTISWFSDPSGGLAVGGQSNLNQLMADVIARYASYYEPAPLMVRSNVTMYLRPDIVPGCRFRHQPFKNESTYDFYIEGVEHSFVFGGPSVSKVTLSRGLPSTVYANAGPGGILFNVLKGNAMRQNGAYTTGIVSGLGSALQPIPPTAFASFLSQVAPIYATAQAVSG